MPDADVKGKFQFNPMEGSATDLHRGRDFCLYVSVCIVLPTVSSIFVYYGFVTNYTAARAFAEEGFRRQYDFNIYRYRVLGKGLLIAIDHLLVKLNDPIALHGGILTFKDPTFYNSYFVLNTCFLLLTMSLLWKIFADYATKITKSERMLWLVLCLYCMMITQYVVTPYDVAAYCFLVLSMLLILRYQDTPSHVGLIGAAVVLGTLTRETESLALSFFLAVYVLRNGFRWTPVAWGVISASAFFLFTYVGLRVVLGSEAQFGRVGGAFLPWGRADSFYKVAASYLFLLSLMASVVIATERARPVIVFQIFSLPYTIATLLGNAFTFEARIWVPLVICTVVLCTVDGQFIGLRDRDGKARLDQLILPRFSSSELRGSCRSTKAP